MRRIQRLGVSPASQSRDTLGIDMAIHRTGALLIVDSNGTHVEISTSPRSGSNAHLRRVGESYGVIKYNRAGRDAPHWSNNGS
jgi:hypothetical protein